ncbi:GNAT family N-acetyltransferase [Paraglaciecola aestuariivivens]
MKIRHQEHSDQNDIFAIYSASSVTENTSQLPYLHSEHVASLFDIENDYVLVAEVENKVVAQVCLLLSKKVRDKHCASLAIAVHPEFQGKGIGRSLLSEALNQADNWLNLIRIELDVFEDNQSAIGLYESLGFEKEGVKRFSSFKQGQYANLVFMARIKPGFVNFKP